MVASDWWFEDLCTSSAAPVFPWEREEYSLNLPEIQDIEEYSTLQKEWNLWEVKEENPYSKMALWYHPKHGEVLTKTNSWPSLPLPLLTKEEFRKVKVLDSIKSLMLGHKLEKLLSINFCAEVYINGEIEYSWHYKTLEELMSEFDGDFQWSPNSCDYYYVSITAGRKEEGVQFYRIDTK